MIIAGLIASALVTAGDRKPDLEGAIACGRLFAQEAVVGSEGAVEIALQAEKSCSSRYHEEIGSATLAISGDASESRDYVRDNIRARIRAAAFDVLIARFEDGQAFAVVEEPSTPAAVAGRSYLQCVRVAAWRKTDTVYRGDPYPLELKGKNPAIIEAFLTSSARQACSATRARGAEAMERQLRSDIRDENARERAVTGILLAAERRAVQPLAESLLEALSDK